MDFYLTDRRFNLLGVVSTSSEATLQMVNETDTQSIENAAREFAGTIVFAPYLSTKIKTLAAYGNYLLYKDEQGKSVFMTIMEIEHDPLNGTHFIRAEDAGMDLLNGYVGPYKATKAMTFKQYFDIFAKDTGFTIGINEITDLSRTLEWDSEEQTILARMLSVATQFDNAEIAFSFTITGTQVVQRRLDVMRKRGADNRIILYANRDINNIVTKGNIYDLATALEVSGGEIDGVPVTLKGYSYTDPTGRFELDPATGILYDTESVKVWSRLLSNDNPNPENGYIKRLKSYETTNKKTLLDNAIRELTKVSQPIVNYETDISKLPDNVLIGDTIYLSDENQELYLSARVLTLDRCYSEETYTATLGDYLIVEDGLALSLKEIAAQLKAETTYLWIRYADDDQGSGMSPSPNGKEYIAIKSVVGVPTASDDPDDYIGLWQKFVGDQGIPGPQGPNGATTYTWLKYADDDQGNGMSDDPAGKMYIGLATNKTTPTESTNPADYKWQLVKGEDGQDAHIYQAYAWSEDGTDRFTTQYPNENGFQNSETPQPFNPYLGTIVTQTDNVAVPEWGATNAVGYKVTGGTATILGTFRSGMPNTIVGETHDYDISIYVKNTGTTNITVSGNITPVTVVAPGEAKRIAWVVKNYSHPTGASRQFVVSRQNTTDEASFVVWRAKYAYGSYTSIWTPKPSEDFANAYPTFMGTYATFDDTQSTDPADYTWARMLGNSGVGIKTTVVEYAVGTSATTAPTSGWQATPPAVGTNQYLWTRITLTYDDGNVVTSYSVGARGAQGPQGPTGPSGNGIDTSVVTYAAGTTGTTAPTTGWQATPPTVAANQFLWTRIVLTYTDGSSTTSYAVGKMGAQGPQGAKGDTGPQGPTGPTGNGISSSTINYAASTSGTTAPATGWQATPPTVAANSFLWTRVVINYTDGTSSTSYSVGKMGAQGPQGDAGAQGPQGPTGNGISSSVVNYAASASGTTAPTSGWATTPPTVAADQFLWTRVVITYTNGTTTTAYSVGKMGAQGPKGDTGAQGPTGPTGPQGPQGIQGVAYLSPTQPSTTQNGAQWFKTVSTTDRTVTDIYTYVTGSGWVKTPLAAGTLAVTSISAISANLGDITAGTINGVSITGAGLYSDYDIQLATGGTQWRKGRLSMAEGKFRNDYQVYTKSSGAVASNGFSLFAADSIQMVEFNGSQTTTPTRTLNIDAFRIGMTDDQGRGGSLTFQDLYSQPKRGIIPASGWNQYSNDANSANFPSAERNGRLVQLAGAFSNQNLLAAGGSAVMGNLAVGFRPSTNCNFIVQASGTNIYLLTIMANGQIQISRHRGWVGGQFTDKDVQAGAWCNIACVFAAADV